MIGISPYGHALNNPIKYNDTEGDIPWDQVMKFTRVSSLQGWRIHPIHKTKKYHGGLDLAAPEGSDVRSLAGGTIVKIGWDANGYGRYVVIKHPRGYYSLYGHLQKSSTDNLKVNQKVGDGQVVGKSGNTGGSTGPHLHLEVSKSNTLSGVFKKENKLDPQSIGDLQIVTHGYIAGYNFSPSLQELISGQVFKMTPVSPRVSNSPLKIPATPLEMSRMTTPMERVEPLQPRMMGDDAVRTVRTIYSITKTTQAVKHMPRFH